MLEEILTENNKIKKDKNKEKFWCGINRLSVILGLIGLFSFIALGNTTTVNRKYEKIIDKEIETKEILYSLRDAMRKGSNLETRAYLLEPIKEVSANLYEIQNSQEYRQYQQEKDKVNFWDIFGCSSVILSTLAVAFSPLIQYKHTKKHSWK